MRTIRLALLAGLLSVGCGSTEDAGPQTAETGSQTTGSGAAGGDTNGTEVTEADASNGPGQGDSNDKQEPTSGLDTTSGGGGDADGATSGQGTTGGDTGTTGSPDDGSQGGGDGLPAEPGEGVGSSANGTADGEIPDEPTDLPSECDTENESTLYLSADDSNSMAGPAVARGLIQRGQKVYKAIRTYEFLNYYDIHYPVTPTQAVGVHASAFDMGDGEYALQLGVSSTPVDAAARRDVNLTLSIDTSSSMGWGPAGETGMDRVKASCHAISAQLRQGDIISIVAWSGDQTVVVDSHLVTGPNDGALTTACNSLKAGGVTNFTTGVGKTYELAKKNSAGSRSNRVVLFSDGGAKVSEDDVELIAGNAADADAEGLYLIGVGVGDPWNYNDALMDALTEAGKGAYIFLDSTDEATLMWGARFISNVQIAARAVQVALTLPPTFQIKSFYGEEFSEDPDEVEPQHLGANDSMIFSQTIQSCAPEGLDLSAPLSVTANFEEPLTLTKGTVTITTSLAELLETADPLHHKGAAVVAYAEALKDVTSLSGAAAVTRIELAEETVITAITALGDDADLLEIKGLLATYKTVFDGTFSGSGGPAQVEGTAIPSLCDGCGTGDALTDMSCALELCGATVVNQIYNAPDGSDNTTRAVATGFGNADNDLSPKEGTTLALMATGPALGTTHSEWLGQESGSDPYTGSGDQAFDTVEWTLDLKAPEGANGFGLSYVFFSEEYDDYVGSAYNDKFYMVLEAGSTNGGAPTVINYSKCRSEETYTDFICGPGMQFCEPGERYCYIAINTAASECCWLNGCPDGTATTDISGTGFECAASQAVDGDASGSSTGWLTTRWPIEPGETFRLTIHLHDTADGVFDSEVILDQMLFYDAVKPGTTSFGFSL